MFINFYSLLILEMVMFKKNLMFKLVFVYDVQRCKQWIECVVFEIFKFESFNPYICVYVWFDFLTIDHCSISCQFVHQDQYWYLYQYDVCM